LMSKAPASKKIPDFKGKKAIVVGLGASGCAAIELLLRQGATVGGTDRAPLEKLAPSLRKLACDLVIGGHEGLDFTKVDLVVMSPGVPTFAQVKAAEAAGVEVIGETELASRFLHEPIYAVGGTNGKSSTTVLLAHLLE